MRKELSTWASEARIAWRDRHKPGWRERMVAIHDEQQREIDRLRADVRRARRELTRANERMAALSKALLSATEPEETPVNLVDAIRK